MDMDFKSERLSLSLNSEFFGVEEVVTEPRRKSTRTRPAACKLGGSLGLVLSGPRIKLFHRTLNCLFDRLLRVLIGGQANERASSGNVRKYFPEVTPSRMEDPVEAQDSLPSHPLALEVCTRCYLRHESYD